MTPGPVAMDGSTALVISSGTPRTGSDDYRSAVERGRRVIIRSTVTDADSKPAG